jgi:hypothetical protein
LLSVTRIRCKLYMFLLRHIILLLRERCKCSLHSTLWYGVVAFAYMFWFCSLWCRNSYLLALNVLRVVKLPMNPRARIFVSVVSSLVLLSSYSWFWVDLPRRLIYSFSGQCSCTRDFSRIQT